ncbi:protein crumbs isoform X1 [Cimex lectularius]|uniref:Protein crumbs n=1 Tax=Cimex lectularius TaxID=79782 RepID=A0A8I6SAR9_CIMLE|nr:protein crumbs isoform X1 [Cimex lectularius]
MTRLLSPVLLWGLVCFISHRVGGNTDQREGFFNKTSFVNLHQPIILNKHIGLSFRSCAGGELFTQKGSSYSITLEVRVEGLFFKIDIGGKRSETRISANLLDNEWHTVNILYRMSNLTISTSGHKQVIANNTLNPEVLTQPDLFSEQDLLQVGNKFDGCILEGPSIVFSSGNHHNSHNVEWGPCPLPTTPCRLVEHCANEPCMMHGRCITLPDRYYCQCAPRYSGNICQIDNGPLCNKLPCKNGATCHDNKGDYVCNCPAGFAGKDCDVNINTQICENNLPCQNNGTCITVGGDLGYKCHCQDGFEGRDCEINKNECLSNPCQHGGTCQDGVNSFSCLCGRTGYTGVRCEININECENNPCLNNGVCFDNYGGYTCQCTTGFGGQNCEQKLSGCASSPCNSNSICVDTSVNTYECTCKPGFTGIDPNCTQIDTCSHKPCSNGATCNVMADGGFACICLPGFTGPNCEVNIDECESSPCKNGGTCFDGANGYLCNCTSDFMGPNCEQRFDACAQKPCLNNGTCYAHDVKDYYCECIPGFEGLHCEHNIDDCANRKLCADDKVCVDGINSYECRCKNGLSGPDCKIAVPHCNSAPCKNGATCTEDEHGYNCICPPGFSGQNCETDIDECKTIPHLCKNGICINKEGRYQCFCTPGFSGDHCEVDFDECLSHPCQNGARCENLINKYQCSCTPGFTGVDCSIDIDECESNPCSNGSSCINEVATFSCVCPPGLTGRYCQEDIDDCKPNPCQNNGQCIDGLNTYTCNCENTGYEGKHCEYNIDECANNNCTNGANCTDLVNNYECLCFPGYEGKNCELDIKECNSNPCKHNGTCYEKSDPSYYLPNPDQPEDTNSPVIFNKLFSFEDAAGYECKCIDGITGSNCEIDINECESSPCEHGMCQDGIASFTCECEAGYEGTYCKTEIDECQKYSPCVYGICHDKVADYFCECDSKYGGKNCSVELTGCLENQCQNNGTCKPYLDDDNVHKFNCSCTNGFQGPTCEKETTMSLNGSSYAMVNTTREEGYDIQFRFKTTLSNGLLAIGKGSTYYILELAQGRLNLRSSILNKWEGVFIGSALNDSKWQKVFVAINSSHLVLAANEEQTIYPILPINLNEGSNTSHTSFPTTYLGGAISYLRRLTHGPSFYVGCVQDVMINGNWVLPQDVGTQPISFVGVEVGCKREPQCNPNPCHSGGHCTDLWRNFSCTCERPYLGRTCQHNLTAATFGHENITESVVHVIVDQAARRAVRSIMDISMFIRTREPSGGIFYLGSQPNSTVYNDETVIAAKLYGGELKVSFQFNGNVESYGVDGVRLDNGFNHLIQVVRNITLVQVKINGTEYFRKTISATGQLDLQYLMLGAVFGNGSEVRNFKGVIQDVEMNNGSRVMVVEFFPLNVEDLIIPPKLGQVLFNNSLVLEGVVSDNSCVDDPCMHGGICTVTWNDFSCACTVGHKGKQCEEMEFCQVQDCPAGSECRNLDHGYECVANITIHKPDVMAPGLQYKFVRGEQNTMLNEISFAYRSKSGGKILQVGPDHNGNRFIVTVYKDQLTVSWNLNGLEDVKTISKDQRDGDWTNVWLKMHDNTITGGLFGASEDTPQYFTSNFSQTAWETFVSMANITIGGMRGIDAEVDDRHTYTTGEGGYTNPVDIIHEQQTPPTSTEKGFYEGCIGEVRFGNLLLPYFTPQALNSSNITSKDHFELLPGSSIGQELGCLLCFDQECHHGGKCTNSTLFYTCTCPPGYDGDACENDIDECKENDCKNNSTCKDGQATYTCDCMPGWQGPLCDIEIDECSTKPCQNGGTCIDRLGFFICECPEEFIGTMCEQLKLVTCDSVPCKNDAVCRDVMNPATNDNFTCDCQDGFLGVYCEYAFCEKKPCENGGICRKDGMKPFCECLPGFTGKNCETDINECDSNPCEHNGLCKDFTASFICNCTGTGFTGSTCNIDIDECEIDDICPANSQCLNTMGSFFCNCFSEFCGPNCSLPNPCMQERCANGGSCVPQCLEKADYICECSHPYTGKNCTEVMQFGSGRVADIALIVVPILTILIVAGLISLSVFLMMARKKRATRGTYSPSSQEYCNPRVELDNVMKPPPEERLI